MDGSPRHRCDLRWVNRPMRLFHICCVPLLYLCVPLLQINHDLHLQKVSCLVECYRTRPNSGYSLKGFCCYAYLQLMCVFFPNFQRSFLFPFSFRFFSIPVSYHFFSFNTVCGHAAGSTGRLGDAVFKFVFFLQLFTFYRATLPSALLHITSYDNVHAHPSDCSSDMRRSL